MSALDKVISWANLEIFPWQADAVRRFLLQGELTDEDRAILYLQMKKHLGFKLEGQDIPEPDPPKQGEISGSGSSNESFVLKSIECVKNVNAIPDGNILPIAHKGLTVVYGENGSGKSGFARTLKRACNARDKTDRLIGNIFGNADKVAPSVKFKIGTDTGDTLIDWSEGEASFGILPKITVLDASCARILLDRKNEFQYKPYGTDVFEVLVTLTKKFKEQLAKESPIPVRPEIENIREGTEAKTFYDSLGVKTKKEELDIYGNWASEEDDELSDLMIWGKELKKADPELKIKSKKVLVEKYTNVVKEVSAIRREFCKKNLGQMNSTIVSLLAAEKAHGIAEKAVSDGEFPLSGVKSLAWTKLFEAAESYSSGVTYKGSEFPFTGEEARCVLCMQVLDGDAKSRMKKFYEHVKDEVGENLKQCTEEHNKLRKAVLQISIRSESDLQGLLSEIIDLSPLAANELIAEFTYYTSLHEKVVACIDSKTEIDFLDVKSFDRKICFGWLRTLQKDIVELENSLKPEEIAKKKLRGKELLSRKSLFDRIEVIRKFVQESKIKARYGVCLEKLDFRNISKRGREIVSEESTPELQAALIGELEAINVTSVAVAFKAHGSAGKTLYDIELTGASTKTALSKVLSEGEQKAIAIASFMAELKLSENSYPIVFDDPVTSLDHIFRDKIAERIALESCSRQVIVFTHDISFVVELEKHVSRLNSERAVITLRHNSTNPGNVVSDKPWNLMKVSDRLVYLDSRIAYLKTLPESDQTKYDEKTAGWYSLFRETWEAIVEEIILNNSIRRFGAEIKTMSIREVEISDEDYKVLDLFMSKASEWMLGHDKSKELSVHRPPTSELANDIVETRAFVKAVNKNRKTVSARRKKLLEPVQAEIG